MARGTGPQQPTVSALTMSRTIILIVALTTSLLLTAGQANAGHVVCGELITEDTTLDSDLLNCPEHGIVIGADNITLDLGGHTIDGLQRDWPFDFGIDNSAGHDGITIRHGTLREFDRGVAFDGALDNHVEGLTVSTNPSGIGISILNASDSNRIEGNALSDNGTGIYLQWSAFNEITLNSITGNRGGLELFGSHVNQLTRNSVSRNGGGVHLLESDRNRMTLNSVVSNDGGGFGIYEDSDDNRIERNLISGNSFGIALGDSYRRPGARRNVILKNDVYDNAFNGIFLQGPNTNPEFPSPGATESLLEGNCVDGNGDDGIDVRNSVSTLTKNKVTNNSDLGIEAVPGVTDSGGNKAYGNGNPLQCLNVTCGLPSSLSVPDRPRCSVRSSSVAS